MGAKRCRRSNGCLGVVALTLSLLCHYSLNLAEASSAAATETLIGIVGRDFVLLGADSSLSQSIALTTTKVDKIAVLVDPFPLRRTTVSSSGANNDHQQQTIAAAVAGDSADADWLVQILRLYGAEEEFTNGVGCDVEFIHNSNNIHHGDEDYMKNYHSAGLSVQAMAHLARREIYQRLRTRSQVKVNLLVAGMMMLPTSTNLPADNSMEQQEYSFSGRVRNQVLRATSSIQSSSLEKQQQYDDDKSFSTLYVHGGKLVPRLFWLDEYGSMQWMKEYGVHGYASAFVWSILDRQYQPNMSLEQAHELMKNCFEQLRKRYLFNSVADKYSPPCIKCIDATGCRLLL